MADVLLHIGSICLVALIAGYFARSLGNLILTQGVLYGAGFVVFYYPILSMVNEFWIERRGFAYGILCSASGVSGAAMPFCLAALLGLCNDAESGSDWTICVHRAIDTAAQKDDCQN